VAGAARIELSKQAADIDLVKLRVPERKIAGDAAESRDCACLGLIEVKSSRL
jgi:hypothetical protein